MKLILRFCGVERMPDRPWGRMWKLIHRKSFWVKLIWAWGRNSLQYHHRRVEYHCGIYQPIVGAEAKAMQRRWLIEIPCWPKYCLGFYRVPLQGAHRMQRGLFVEVAVGAPDECDIVRLQDDYGRSPEQTADYPASELVTH